MRYGLYRRVRSPILNFAAQRLLLAILLPFRHDHSRTPHPHRPLDNCGTVSSRQSPSSVPSLAASWRSSLAAAPTNDKGSIAVDGYALVNSVATAIRGI